MHEIHQPAAVQFTHPTPPAEFFPLTEAALASGDVPHVPVAPVGMLHGEFDTQRALLIGGNQMIHEMPELFAELVSHCRGRVEAIVLVQGDANRKLAEKVLADHVVDAPHVHYVNVPHNSMWTRDFGPLTVWQPGGRPALIDASYACPDRADDDAVPAALAEALHLPVVRSPLLLDGGNLLSNGRGLLVATYDLVGKNLSPTMDAVGVRSELGHVFGAREVVFFQPLIGEPTGHVDMFMTFTSAHTAVVASIAPEIDPENSRILDQNAARLANVRINGRKLRVVRVPMPHHDDGIWRSHTNVVYLNGLLLVPTYPATDDEGAKQAVATFQKLLPTWRVQAIDAEALATLGGALHCVTMNLSGLEKAPQWMDKQPPENAHTPPPHRQTAE